ncbi:TatD family hydrolase [Teredinibacter haidensis]|uniref:TatD family hydrolase n=1 Tax=Teredinibacter haidensis TaxID=2731755 RepID=UPI000948DED3|nr:TatD family hydrolase [Teredinibacter haidensis]
MLVDSHCHLDRLNLSKYPNGLTGAIDAAKELGVSKMLCVCISEENKQQVLDIALQHEGIYASVGVHPSDVSESIVSVEQLKNWSKDEKIVALGETGLDYYYSAEKAEQQKESFANHLIAGAELGLPVIIHTRDAREDTLTLMREYASSHSAGVMHCFTESWEMAQQALDLNFYISISGIVTFKNADALREVTKKVPLDKLLIETDSPYLAPVPYRGKPNEPKYVRAVAEAVADLRGISFDELAETTSRNFANLFLKNKL